MLLAASLIAAAALAPWLWRCRAPAAGQDKSIVVASTTSTQDSGLFATSCRCSRRRPGST